MSEKKYGKLMREIARTEKMIRDYRVQELRRALIIHVRENKLLELDRRLNAELAKSIKDNDLIDDLIDQLEAIL